MIINTFLTQKVACKVLNNPRFKLYPGNAQSFTSFINSKGKYHETTSLSTSQKVNLTCF